MTEAEIIPTRRCKILWSYNENMEIVEVDVLWKGVEEDKRQSKMIGSSGAICQGWDDGSDPYLTPAGVFGYMLRHGFASDASMKQALNELAKIDSAEWARQMLNGVEPYSAQ